MQHPAPHMAISTYVDNAVPMIAPPPYIFKGVDSFSYLLGTKEEGREIAEHFIRTYLNGPLGRPNGGHIYHVPPDGTRPLLTFSSIGESASEKYPDVKISYLEVALQIAVIITSPDDGSNSGNNVYLPVLFIDGLASESDQKCRIDSRHATSPIVVGRELYGLPKIPAAIDMKYSGLRLKSAMVEFYGEPVISATGTKTEGESDGEDDQPLDEKQRRALAEELFGKMKPNKDWTVGTTIDKFQARIDLLNAGLPKCLIGLRQFRTPDNFLDAAGRAVIEAPYEITSGDPRPMGNNVTVRFSPRIAEALKLRENYDIERHVTNGVVFLNASARFGGPGPVVRPAP